jgi:hypothetical protein
MPLEHPIGQSLVESCDIGKLNYIKNDGSCEKDQLKNHDVASMFEQVCSIVSNATLP